MRALLSSSSHTHTKSPASRSPSAFHDINCFSSPIARIYVGRWPRNTTTGIDQTFNCQLSSRIGSRGRPSSSNDCLGRVKERRRTGVRSCVLLSTACGNPLRMVYKVLLLSPYPLIRFNSATVCMSARLSGCDKYARISSFSAALRVCMIPQRAPHLQDRGRGDSRGVAVTHVNGGVAPVRRGGLEWAHRVLQRSATRSGRATG